MPLHPPAEGGEHRVDAWYGGPSDPRGARAQLLVPGGVLSAVVVDLVLCAVVLALLEIPVSLPVVAAMLTVIGYSVNDSVVLWAHARRDHRPGASALGARVILTGTVAGTLSGPTLPVAIGGMGMSRRAHSAGWVEEAGSSDRFRPIPEEVPMANSAGGPTLSRRSFVGSGVAATLGAAAGAGAVSGGDEASAKDTPYNPRTRDAMPTRNLGRTGYQVGIFSLGGQAKLERTFAAEESVEIVNRAIDLGVNYIDSAAAYGKDESWESVHGTSERNIGQVMKHRRSEVFLASKTHERDYDGSMRLLESSLRNLQTDHLDLWQLHNIKRQDDLDRIFARDGAIKALEKARGEGTVRYLGVTGHYEPLVLVQALERYDFDTILMVVSAADPNYLSFKDHLLPVALAKGVGIIAMKLAARGRLISEWAPPPLEEQQQYMRTSLPGTISMKESLHYTCTQPVSTCIVGVDDVKQLEGNVEWASEFLPLSPEKMTELERRTLPIVRQALYFRRWDMGA